MSLRKNLEVHLTQLVRDRDPYLSPKGHFYVQQYLREQFSQWGTLTSHTFQFRGKQHQNLILNLSSQRKTSSKRQTVLVGAHYDAVIGSPGADDNATGVAVLLELARLLSENPPHSPIQLVAFDLEEMGLIGSQAYAAELHQQRVPLRLMLSLEMLGYRDRTPGSQVYPPGLRHFYPNRGDFIGLIGNWSSIPDLIRLSRNIQQAGQVPCEWLPAGKRGLLVPDTRRSDHAPFWDLGYRAIMVTDTANLRNPHYHSVSDRLETLDLDFLTGVCQGLAQGIRVL